MLAFLRKACMALYLQNEVYVRNENADHVAFSHCSLLLLLWLAPHTSLLAGRLFSI